MTESEHQYANTFLSFVPRYGTSSALESLALAALLMELRELDGRIRNALKEDGAEQPERTIVRRYHAAHSAATGHLARGEDARVVGIALELAIDAGEAVLARAPIERAA